MIWIWIGMGLCWWVICQCVLSRTCLGPDSCISCRPSKMLSGKTCLDQCAPGQVSTEGSSSCHQCHSSCATCNGLTPDACTSCPPGLRYADNMCTACGIRQFFSNGSCQDCHSGCKTCLGPSAHHCTSCPSQSLPVEWQGSCDVTDGSSGAEDTFTVNVLFAAVMLLCVATAAFVTAKMRPCRKKTGKRRAKFLRTKFKAVSNGHKNGDYRQLPVNGISDGGDDCVLLEETESEDNFEDGDDGIEVKRLIWDTRDCDSSFKKNSFRIFT